MCFHSWLKKAILCFLTLQRVRVGGYYVNKRTPCRKLTLKRGGGGGRLIRTLRYIATNLCDKVPVIARLRLIAFAGKSWHLLAGASIQTRGTLTCDHELHRSQVKVHPGAHTCSFRFCFCHVPHGWTDEHTDTAKHNNRYKL